VGGSFSRNGPKVLYRKVIGSESIEFIDTKIDKTLPETKSQFTPEIPMVGR